MWFTVKKVTQEVRTVEIRDFYNTYRDHQPRLLGGRSNFAVLVPLVETEQGLCLLYEVRADGIRQPHEVCFPGGRMEPGETPTDCALRETREELGIPESAVTVIGEMDFIHIRAGSLLRPVLGEVDPAALAAMRPAPEEVAGTFLLPLRELKAHPPEVYLYRQPVEAPDFPYADAGVPADYPWRPWRLEVPVYHGLPYHLWGITARITMDLLAHL